MTVREETKERDAAEAKCAEMREALKTAGGFTAYDSEGQRDYPFCESLAYQHALSSDCGKGFISVKELDATLGLLVYLQQGALAMPETDLPLIQREQARLEKLRKDSLSPSSPDAAAASSNPSKHYSAGGCDPGVCR